MTKNYNAGEDIIHTEKGDVNIGKIDKSKVVLKGDFHGSNINVKSTLNNVTNTISSIPDVDDDTKTQLENLFKQLESALERALIDVPDKAQDAEAVAKISETLIKEASAEKPNKTTLQITGDGLKAAARNLADIAPDVLGIATKIISLVAAFI